MRFHDARKSFRSNNIMFFEAISHNDFSARGKVGAGFYLQVA
jgi:hypothetical protein